jgi:fructose-bisphosphate aldolase, class II
MPIASPEVYRAMLDAAKAGQFAYPAINVTSSETLNAALAGFTQARSDGIIQVSTGAAAFVSGPAINDMALGAIALAEFAHRVAERYDVFIALHTDHCPVEKLDHYVKPLLAETRARRERGQGPLFQSHMFDGSALPLQQNLAIAADLLAECAELEVILELEIGVVGGEEDGISGEGVPNAKLYTTPQDMLAVAERLGTGEQGRYLLAATFGNVHGVYQPGHVRLRPSILRDGQEAVTALRAARRVRSGVSRGQRLIPGVQCRQDERRRGHAVRLYPCHRRPHVPQLWGRPESGWRGRRQESV